MVATPVPPKPCSWKSRAAVSRRESRVESGIYGLRRRLIDRSSKNIGSSWELQAFFTGNVLRYPALPLPRVQRLGGRIHLGRDRRPRRRDGRRHALGVLDRALRAG